MSNHQLARIIANAPPVKPINRDEHSEVGASGRQRWSVCAGSRKFIRRLPKHKSGAAAQWGNDAHDHGEKYLRHLLQGGPKPARIADKEMRECVQEYVERCIAAMYPYVTAGHTLRVWIEDRFTLPGMPDAYGTVDFAFYVVELKLLVVIDLKTGGGILVKSYENRQLLYYGAALMFQEFLEVKEALLAISAPRAPEDYRWKPWTVTGTRLFEELSTLRAEIVATEADDAPLVSGDHCVKSFCPALAVCPARQAEASAMAALDFAPGASIETSSGATVDAFSREELARLFFSIDRIKATCDAISKFAHAEAYAGRPLPGTKLVDKRLGNRKWKPGIGPESFAVDPELNVQTLMEYELKSPTQVEKLLPARLKHLVDYEAKNSFVVRESSGTTLVAESDKRPAATLTDDFAAVPLIGDSE